jgi:hypothetical protein
VTTPGPQQPGHTAPYFLPDGRHLLFASGGGIYLGTLDGEAPTLVTPAASSGVYLPSGWLLWVRRDSQTLVAQRLDISKRVLTGSPVTVADRVGSRGPSDGIVGVSVTATGLMRTGRQRNSAN